MRPLRESISVELDVPFRILGDRPTCKHFKGVKIINKTSLSNGEFTLSGNYFVGLYDENTLFHSLVDIVGQYLKIKEFCNDLKLLLLSGGPKDRPNAPPYFIELISIIKQYGSEVEVIRMDEFKTILIQDMYFINPGTNHLLRYCTPSIDRYIDNDFLSWPQYIKAFANFVNKNIDPNPLYENIFISRRSVSDQGRQEKLYIESLLGKEILFYPDGSSNIDEYDLLMLNSFLDDDRHVIHKLERVLERWISDEDESQIEDYFREIGYFILDPMSLSIFEQLRVILGAKNIATLSGGGLALAYTNQTFNSFIVINTNLTYRFDHEHIAEQIMDGVTFVVSNSNQTNQKIFSAKEIISQLSKILQ